MRAATEMLASGNAHRLDTPLQTLGVCEKAWSPRCHYHGILRVPRWARRAPGAKVVHQVIEEELHRLLPGSSVDIHYLRHGNVDGVKWARYMNKENQNDTSNLC